MINKNLKFGIFKKTVLVTTLFVMSILPALAKNSGRPPSVFSECCCERGEQGNKQVVYECDLYDNTCPPDTILYPGYAINCPSTLIVKKYKK